MPEISVQVAVRVRPFNKRELDAKAKNIITMKGGKTTILDPETQKTKDFNFDYSFWSHDGFDTAGPDDADGYEEGYYFPSLSKPNQNGFPYASQKEVFNSLGSKVLMNALAGYNSCLFAYGQTGSGKSYSFVGYGTNRGVVPQVCEAVFKKKAQIQAEGNSQLNVKFSMLEIYNEKLRDLLSKDKKKASSLKIRSPPTGTYVENLHEDKVVSYEDIEACVDRGTTNRTVASTNMNATSSRAHTVMCINIEYITVIDGQPSAKTSDMNLIDLAGSERAESTGATGDRLAEGAAINKSLSELGNVISALAEVSQGKKVFVPYRNSKLTELLQSALGGNCSTIMVAALSPADINYAETLSTLRYADRAKQIKMVVEVNESPTDKLIRQLRDENTQLKTLLTKLVGHELTKEELSGALELAPLPAGALELQMSAGAAASSEPEPEPEPPKPPRMLGQAHAGMRSSMEMLTEEAIRMAVMSAVKEMGLATKDMVQSAMSGINNTMHQRRNAAQKGYLVQDEFAAVLRSAVYSSYGGGDTAAADRAFASAHEEMNRLVAVGRKEAGVAVPENAINLVHDALASMTTADARELERAYAKVEVMLGEGSTVWDDSFLSKQELMESTKELLDLCPSASRADRTEALNSAVASYDRLAEINRQGFLTKGAMHACLQKVGLGEGGKGGGKGGGSSVEIVEVDEMFEGAVASAAGGGQLNKRAAEEMVEAAKAQALKEKAEMERDEAAEREAEKAEIEQVSEAAEELKDAPPETKIHFTLDAHIKEHKGYLEGEHQLMTLARAGEDEKVEELLDEYWATDLKELRELHDIVDESERAETPMIAACREGHAEVVKHLLNSGFSPDQEAYDGTTPLIEASLFGRLEVVNTLLRWSGVGEWRGNKKVWNTQCDTLNSRNAPQAGDWTALMAAVIFKHVDVAYALVREGVQIANIELPERVYMSDAFKHLSDPSQATVADLAELRATGKFLLDSEKPKPHGADDVRPFDSDTVPDAGAAGGDYAGGTGHLSKSQPTHPSPAATPQGPAPDTNQASRIDSAPPVSTKKEEDAPLRVAGRPVGSCLAAASHGTWMRLWAAMGCLPLPA